MSSVHITTASLLARLQLIDPRSKWTIFWRIQTHRYTVTENSCRLMGPGEFTSAYMDNKM